LLDESQSPIMDAVAAADADPPKLDVNPYEIEAVALAGLTTWCSS
jgi:hypothetical protein